MSQCKCSHLLVRPVFRERIYAKCLIVFRCGYSLSFQSKELVIFQWAAQSLATVLCAGNNYWGLGDTDEVRRDNLRHCCVTYPLGNHVQVTHPLGFSLFNFITNSEDSIKIFRKLENKLNSRRKQRPEHIYEGTSSQYKNRLDCTPSLCLAGIKSRMGALGWLDGYHNISSWANWPLFPSLLVSRRRQGRHHPQWDQ